MQFFKRRLILVGSIVLAVAAALVGIWQYQNYAREKRNEELIRYYKLRQEQQQKHNALMNAHRDRPLIKNMRPSAQRRAKSPEKP